MKRYASLLLPLMLLMAAPLHAQITQQVADINPNGDAHVSDSMTEFQDAVYFGADDGTTGRGVQGAGRGEACLLACTGT